MEMTCLGRLKFIFCGKSLFISNLWFYLNFLLNFFIALFGSYQ